MQAREITRWAERQVEAGADRFDLVQLGADGGVIDSYPAREIGEVGDPILETCRAAAGERCVLHAFAGKKRIGALPLPPAELGLAQSLLAYDARSSVPAGVERQHPLIEALMAGQTHVERLHRMAIIQSGTTSDHLTRMLAEAMEEIRRLRRQVEKHAEAREGMISQAHERKLASETASARQKLNVEIVGEMIPLGKLLVSKLMGKPDKVGAMSMAIEAFGNSLTEDQLVGVFEVLNPIQRASLGHVLGVDAQGRKPKADDAEKPKEGQPS